MGALITDGSVQFAVNDILRLKNTVDDEYMRVTATADISHYTVTRDLAGSYGAGANPSWKAGSAVVKLGNSNGVDTYSQGWLKLLGEGTNSPYYEVVKRTGVSYNAYTPYARLGNLNGFLDYSADEYGIAVGDANDYLSYDPTNKLRIVGSGTNAITIKHGSDILLEHGGDIKFTSVTAPTACTAALVAVAGNVDAGTHTYKITYVNATGETELGTASNTVTNDATYQQNSLTSIPTSTSASVTSRKIYRTRVGGSYYYLLDTIANNTTTTYTDNTADASLGTDIANWKNNTTFGKIIVDNIVALSIENNNTFVGRYAGDDNTTGYENTFLGYVAGYVNTTGLANTFIGTGAGYDNTTGYENTFLGYAAGANNVSGNRNVFIGGHAGSKETGSDKLFIDNQGREDEADGRIKALMYGVFNPNPANQSLRVNATLDLNSIGKIINVVNPVNPQDATTKNWCETAQTASVITSLGAQVEALDMGTQLINNVVNPASAQDAATKNYVDVYHNAGCSVKLSTGQLNLTNATATKIIFDTENYDLGADFDSTTNYRFTADTAGKYLVTLELVIGNPPSDYGVAQYSGYIFKNGAQDGPGGLFWGALATGKYITITLSRMISLAVNDYIEGYARQDTGANTIDINDATEMTIQLIHKA